MPSVEPFLMDSLSLQLTGGPQGYRVNLKNMEIFGASNFTVKSIKWVPFSRIISKNERSFSLMPQQNFHSLQTKRKWSTIRSTYRHSTSNDSRQIHKLRRFVNHPGERFRRFWCCSRWCNCWSEGPDFDKREIRKNLLARWQPSHGTDCEESSHAHRQSLQEQSHFEWVIWNVWIYFYSFGIG